MSKAKACKLRSGYPITSRARLALRNSTQMGQAEAAAADAGIALLPHFVGRADSRLHLCALEGEPLKREYWLLTRSSDQSNLTVRTAADYVIQMFEDCARAFRVIPFDAPLSDLC
jgi:DNA-binding transcriptional LysR family regulator